MALRLEGRRADEELIHEDAEAPHIHHVVVRLQPKPKRRRHGQAGRARQGEAASDNVLLGTFPLPTYPPWTTRSEQDCR